MRWDFIGESGIVLTHLFMDKEDDEAIAELFRRSILDVLLPAAKAEKKKTKSEVVEAACHMTAENLLEERKQNFSPNPLCFPFLVTFDCQGFLIVIVVWAKADSVGGCHTFKSTSDYERIVGPSLSSVEKRVPGIARDLLVTVVGRDGPLHELICARRFAEPRQWELVDESDNTGFRMRPALYMADYTLGRGYTPAYRLCLPSGERAGPFNVTIIVDKPLQREALYQRAEYLKMMGFNAPPANVEQLKTAYKETVHTAMPFLTGVSVGVGILCRKWGIEDLANILLGFLGLGATTPVDPPVCHGHADPVIATWRKVVADDESRPTHGHAVRKRGVRFGYLWYVLMHLDFDPKHSGVVTKKKYGTREWTLLGDFHDLETALQSMADYKWEEVELVLYLN